MRGKATFRYGRKFRVHGHSPMGGAPGAHIQPSDKELPEELIQILCYERAIRNEEWPRWTSLKDVHYTLNELLKLDDEQLFRVRLDDITEMQITSAACRFCKRHTDEPPPNWTEFTTYSPCELREIISSAIEKLPENYRRPQLERGNIRFARILANYWQRSTGNEPTAWRVSDLNQQSEFVSFAVDCFHRLGGHCYALESVYEFIKKALKS